MFFKSSEEDIFLPFGTRTTWVISKIRVAEVHRLFAVVGNSYARHHNVRIAVVQGREKGCPRLVFEFDFSAHASPSRSSNPHQKRFDIAFRV